MDLVMRNLFRQWGYDRRATTAVEFAFVAPLFVTLMLGIVAFGSVISVDNGLQQIVAEAARASVAGLSDTERDQLARTSVAANARSYAFIDPTKMTVSTDEPSSTAFRISVTYDMSSLIAYHLLAALPLPPAVVTRSAVVQRGGF